MEKVAYCKKSLQKINVIFGVVVISMLWMYKVVFHEYYMGNSFWLTLIIPLLIIGISILGIIIRENVIYQSVLYAGMWITTIVIIDISYLSHHNQFFSLQLIMIFLCIFAIFKVKIMRIYIAVTLVCIGPIITIADILLWEKIILLSTLFSVLILGELKSQYDVHFFYEYKESIASKNQILFNINEAFTLNQIIFDEHKQPIDYQFLEVNPAFETITGLKNSEIRGRSVLELMPGTEKRWIEFYGKVVLEKKQFKTVDFSKELNCYFEVTAYPVGADKFATLFLDVTDKMQTERELKYAVKRSEQSDRLKIQFLRDVNHRLRTPLNGMMGMLQLVEYDELNDNHKELYESVVVEMKNCRNIISQIAKYVDIQGMDFEFVKGIPSLIIRHSIDMLMIENWNIQFKSDSKDENEEVFLEKKVLKIVLKEVLTNAVKHTTNKKVDVFFYTEWNSVDDSKNFAVKVIDYGIGISKEHLEYIFNEFYHHDLFTINSEDDKISLPMCKQMLNNSGGDILVDSMVGRGTAFTIVFPIFYN